jgi:hypothetical protein
VNTSSIPEVQPAEASRKSEPRMEHGFNTDSDPWATRVSSVALSWPLIFLGWCWRILVGGLLCFSLIGSIVVTGWTYRWMQGRVLRGWWKRSRLREQGSFEDFGASLGYDAPVARPRWLLQEGMKTALNRPDAAGRQPSTVRKILRALRLPWHSLWLNFKIGFQGLFCTYLLTGLGCLIMLFSWEFGWLNSFNKGYEQALVGPLAGLAGIFLFIVAMLYVPMAQAHQAVTGEARAFFDFRFVWRLIQAKPIAYTGLAAVTALAALPLIILKTAPVAFDDHFDLWSQASDAEVSRYLRYYLLGCAAFLFLTLLVVRLLASRLYQTAVLRVLERGWVARGDVHPGLNQMLKRLGLLPVLPEAAPRFACGAGTLGGWIIGAADLVVFLIALAAALAAGPAGLFVVLAVWGFPWLVLWLAGLWWHRGKEIGAFNLRRLAFGFLFWIWFAFVAQIYVSEFLNYHPVVGLVNHVLVQFPCFDFLPLRGLTPP